MDIDNQKYKVLKNISKTNIEWLWYPYIPCGKITILQGDPGCGKSMLMMDIIARLTAGTEMPDGAKLNPSNVIYQCAEDGYEDTIKPRLEKLGADESRIMWVNEDDERLTLDDEKIRQAIIDLKARLVVIDPFQAYLGDSDLTSATGMRRIMTKLSLCASAYNCAVVLVGHMTKKSSAKELYRGLGSVDIVALARSVLQVEFSEEDPSVRYLNHVKSSLASAGSRKSFRINNAGDFYWIGAFEKTNDCYAVSRTTNIDDSGYSKTSQAGEMIISMLRTGQQRANDVIEQIEAEGIGSRTIKIAKKNIGVVSVRKNNVWYWSLPGSNRD